MKQQNLRLSSLLLAALLATSCSNENDPVAPINPADNPEAVELGVTAGVSLTKSAITGGETQTESASTIMQSIAVFAVGSGTSYSGGNNKAVYKLSDGEWDNSETDRSKIIYLTNEVATIYAVHPEYDPSQLANTEWKITPAADATIGISVFADASGNVSKDDNNTIPTTGNGILSAPGEIDYMYAVDGSTPDATNQPTASNGRTASSSKTDKAWEVSLKMKHALAMVSFRIYNDGTYAGPGKLTKIVLKNSDSGTALSKGTSPTMAIKNGTIVPGNAVAATYTRFIGSDGYTLQKVSTDQNADGAKNASSKFSILVLPHNGPKNTMQVEFTIDGAVYDVPLASGATPTVNWSAGSNNLYTAKLSGKELTLSSVTVEAWGEKDSGNLPIN